MKISGMNNPIAMDATDLTQLSSREQLSALMDGALPADETRFLLRRLQHDDSLAECWERWRLSAEVMRGLAPAQRLPSDFAAGVTASLRGEELHASNTTNATSARKGALGSPAWLRWSGGAAMAASLAVVAFMTQQAGPESPGSLPSSHVVAATNVSPAFKSDAIALSVTPSKPAPHAPTRAPANAGFESQSAALATAVAMMAKPSRSNRRVGVPMRAMQSNTALPAMNVVQGAPIQTAIAVNDVVQPLMPQAGITTRPWPRSVLPQYGAAGMSVGFGGNTFGENTRNSSPYNPFQVRSQIGSFPSKLGGHLDAQAEKPSASEPHENGQEGAAANESSLRP